MCLAVYLASRIPLPTSKWNRERPEFYLEAVSEIKDRLVVTQFTLSNVYFAGSRQGCGCGFLKDGETDEELKVHQENYRSLGRVLDEILKQGARAELFACWEGDQAEPAEFTDELTIAQLLAPEFEFKELQFVRVVGAS